MTKFVIRPTDRFGRTGDAVRVFDTLEEAQNWVNSRTNPERLKINQESVILRGEI